MIYDKFCDYMYYLLLSSLKRVKKAFNQWYLLFKVLGKRMDHAKELIYKASMQTMAATCEEELLPVFARERRLVRYEGEGAENFRKRIVNCAEIYKYGGTDAGIVKIVQSLGYEDVEIRKAKDLNSDADRWAEFYVIININVISGWHSNLPALQSCVRGMKQVGAKDNYLFVFHAENQMAAVNENLVDACVVVWINPEGTPDADANAVMLADAGTPNEIDSRVLTNVWRLDGRHKLDGSMRLNAKVEDYIWGQ